MEEIIKNTKNYDIFKFLEGNRNIDTKHVNSLIESIKNKNLLSVRPILVDEKFNILDGQHRLEAAKMLDLPIFYFQISSDDKSEIIKLNQNNKNWKLKDFLKFHSINNNNKNYINILVTLNKFGWCLEEFFIFSDFNIRKIKCRKIFENGEYIFETNEDNLQTLFSSWNSFKQFVTEKKLEHASAIDSLIFKDSFCLFCKCTQVKIDQFWEKLRANPNLFFRCRNKDEYLDLFLKIYNHGIIYKLEKGMMSYN